MLRLLKYVFLSASVLAFILPERLIYAQEKQTFSIFVTGNTTRDISDTTLLNQWKKQTSLNENFAVLLAGNVANSKSKSISEKFILNENHPLLIAPGKAEWANGTRSGKDFIKQLNENLSVKIENPVFFPEQGCPGPVEVVLNDHLVVILIDTYWWVHKFDRRFNKCGIENPGDVLIMIEDAIRRHYRDKHVVIAGHHSLKSYGNTSGYFSAGQWLVEFPYTFFRKMPGIRIDNRYPDFKDFRDRMISVLKKYPNVVYVSAGEANLQYFQNEQVHYIISGSWERQGYVNLKLPEFGSKDNGFSRLIFSADGNCSLAFFNANQLLFQKSVYKREFVAPKPRTVFTEQLPDSVGTMASTRYNISEAADRWLGRNYRDIWEMPVKVKVFDIGTKKGGLKILQRGGGMQTYSLRLEDADGKQYVLRSIDKYVEPVIPIGLRNTFAVDLVQDQISASNPYAAPVVAALAEQAGVYHTNPEVLYVPDDPQLGIHRRDMAGKLFLFEERPAGDRSDVASFGGSESIISTEKVIEKTSASSNNFVDAESFLRARLFDIVINDWDRHEDQWRWAGFEKNGKTVYKPIPRDRDQAFFVNEGIVPWIAARKWLLPKIQGFAEYTENMDGLAFNARYLDRTFLTGSSWEDWLSQIDSLKTLLTANKIDSAMLVFPNEVYPLCGPQTAQILKARLENLEPMARKLYLSLAKEVSITGTNEADLFEIEALSDTVLQISGFEIKSNNEKGNRFYHRIFFSSETKTIHLYGLEGKDRFDLAGNHPGKIKLNIIGGENNDEVSVAKSSSLKNFSIYDTENTDISPKIARKLKTRYDPKALEYNREDFKYDVVYPGIYSGYNPDDGIFLGGGPIFTKYSRYRQQDYVILGNYAFANVAFNLRFASQNSFPLRRLDIHFNMDYNSPEYAGNFFGLGNDTRWEVPKSEKEFYRLRMRRYSAQLDFIKWLDTERIHKAGPGLQYSYDNAEETVGRFISQPGNGLTENDLAAHSYAGVYFKYEFNTLDGMQKKTEEEFAGSSVFPSRGMHLKTRASYFAGTNQQSSDFVRLTGDWATYLSFSQRPRVVYALRVGGEKLFGDYAFHEAAKLGHTENLRGFRESRFYGDASLYVNAEIRIRMKRFQTYLLNGTAGVLLFNDTGRVWLEGEDSKRWHNGTGLGLWFSPFDMAVVSVSYAASSEDRLLNFSVNYQF